MQTLTNTVETAAKSLSSDTKTSVIKDIIKALRQLHRTPPEILQKSLRPTYHHCATKIGGKGAYKLMAEHYGKTITGHSPYEKIRIEFETELDRIMGVVAKRTSDMDSKAIDAIRTKYMSIIPVASDGLQQHSGVAQEIVRECLEEIANELEASLEIGAEGKAACFPLAGANCDVAKSENMIVKLMLGR